MLSDKILLGPNEGNRELNMMELLFPHTDASESIDMQRVYYEYLGFKRWYFQPDLLQIFSSDTSTLDMYFPHLCPAKETATQRNLVT